jgi:amino acid transporter
MNRKIVFCGIAIIGLLAMLLALNFVYPVITVVVCVAFTFLFFTIIVIVILWSLRSNWIKSRENGHMDRKKVVFCGIAIIGFLLMLLTLRNITQQQRAGKLLYEIGVPGISTEKLRATIKEYYDSYYENVYPTYADFINSLILSPESVTGEKYHLKGNRMGIHYGPRYLRFFVVRAHYGSELLSKNTQLHIDNSLLNDDEDIGWGGLTWDGKQVQAALPITLGQLIKDLKGNNQIGQNN